MRLPRIDPRILTLEIGTKLKGPGAEAEAMAEKAVREYGSSGLRDAINARLAGILGGDKARAGVAGLLTDHADDMMRGAVHMQSPSPASISDASGSWEGVISPNLRVEIPNGYRDDALSAAAGDIGAYWDQAAVAGMARGVPGEGKLTTPSVFAPEVSGARRDMEMKDFLGRIERDNPGVSISSSRVPGGHLIDTNPIFGDEITAADLEKVRRSAGISFGDRARTFTKGVDTNRGVYVDTAGAEPSGVATENTRRLMEAAAQDRDAAYYDLIQEAIRRFGKGILPALGITATGAAMSGGRDDRGALGALGV